MTSARESRDRLKRHRRRMTGRCYDNGFGFHIAQYHYLNICCDN